MTKRYKVPLKIRADRILREKGKTAAAARKEVLREKRIEKQRQDERRDDFWKAAFLAALPWALSKKSPEDTSGSDPWWLKKQIHLVVAIANEAVKRI